MVKKFKEFRIGDIFFINKTNGVYNAINTKIYESRVVNAYPYVVRTSKNNGERGYIIGEEDKLNKGNTISFAQDTAEIFYRCEPYYTGDKIKVLELKDETICLTDSIAMYLISVMKKAFSTFRWGTSSFDVKVLTDVLIKLPITEVEEIDWDFMDKSMRALEKVVIADVVKYKDRVIQTTKEVVGKKA